MNKSYFILFLPIVSFLLGLWLFYDPYLTVSEHVTQQFSVLGDVENGVILFTIKSRGTLTTNYPIDVYVDFAPGKNMSQYFQPGNFIAITIMDSYLYPIKQYPSGIIQTGYISISPTEKRGKGTIVFPNPGSFQRYFVTVNNETLIWINTQDEPTLFPIESFSVRFQMESTNRSIGVAIMSLSVTVIGLLLKMLLRSSKENVNNVRKRGKKVKSEASIKKEVCGDISTS